MLSYNNDPEFKERAIKSAEHHAKADMLIKGQYGHVNGSFKGCSVGCDAYDIFMEQGKDKDYINDNIKSPHEITSKYFGVPEWLERCRDTFFENLEDNTGWHVRFKQAIPAGVSEERFNIVKSKFLLFILDENIERVNQLDISDDLKKKVVDAIKQCQGLHQTVVNGGEWNESAAWSARSAAESAAWSARSAAWSARSAAWSARSAAWSAESAVRSAWSARSAAWSAESAVRSAWSARSAAWSAESAAWSAAFQQYADKLLELLEDA